MVEAGSLKSSPPPGLPLSNYNGKSSAQYMYAFKHNPPVNIGNKPKGFPLEQFSL